MERDDVGGLGGHAAILGATEAVDTDTNAPVGDPYSTVASIARDVPIIEEEEPVDHPVDRSPGRSLSRSPLHGNPCVERAGAATTKPKAGRWYGAATR